MRGDSYQGRQRTMLWGFLVAQAMMGTGAQPHCPRGWWSVVQWQGGCLCFPVVICPSLLLLGFISSLSAPGSWQCHAMNRMSHIFCNRTGSPSSQGHWSLHSSYYQHDTHFCSPSCWFIAGNWFDQNHWIMNSAIKNKSWSQEAQIWWHLWLSCVKGDMSFNLPLKWNCC